MAPSINHSRVRALAKPCYPGRPPAAPRRAGCQASAEICSARHQISPAKSSDVSCARSKTRSKSRRSSAGEESGLLAKMGMTIRYPKTAPCLEGRAPSSGARWSFPSWRTARSLRPQTCADASSASSTERTRPGVQSRPARRSARSPRARAPPWFRPTSSPSSSPPF
jgi:hypothetical protein